MLYGLICIYIYVYVCMRTAWSFPIRATVCATHTGAKAITAMSRLMHAHMQRPLHHLGHGMPGLQLRSLRAHSLLADRVHVVVRARLPHTTICIDVVFVMLPPIYTYRMRLQYGNGSRSHEHGCGSMHDGGGCYREGWYDTTSRYTHVGNAVMCRPMMCMHMCILVYVDTHAYTYVYVSCS
jgi:hypothetical protein